ncbi:hypothetical protein D3C78_1581400 [compost metagenome]
MHLLGTEEDREEAIAASATRSGSSEGGSAVDSGRLAELEARIAALEERLARLEQGRE